MLADVPPIAVTIGKILYHPQAIMLASPAWAVPSQGGAVASGVIRRRPGGSEVLQAGCQERPQADREQNGCRQQDGRVRGRVEDSPVERLEKASPAGNADCRGVDSGDCGQRPAAPDPREHPQAHRDGQQRERSLPPAS
jgi:hypothetical protein